MFYHYTISVNLLHFSSPISIDWHYTNHITNSSHTASLVPKPIFCPLQTPKSIPFFGVAEVDLITAIRSASSSSRQNFFSCSYFTTNVVVRRLLAPTPEHQNSGKTTFTLDSISDIDIPFICQRLSRSVQYVCGTCCCWSQSAAAA